MTEIAVTGLNIYPIKSAAAIPVETATVTPTGLANDRMFMLVDEEGKFVTQRVKDIGPKLVHVKPTLHRFRGFMDVSVEGFGEINDIPTFVRPESGRSLDLVEASIHNNSVTGAAVSQEADKFFSEYLGMPLRMLRVLEDRPRFVQPEKHRQGASNRVGFADAHAALLTSQQSLEELSASDFLKARYPDGLPMDRFRPNIVVDGEGLEPYAEDFWRFIRFTGGVGAYLVKPCKRCDVPDIDQVTGDKGKEVRRALDETRKGVSREGDATGTFFGQNLNFLSSLGHTIRVGDLVTVAETAPEPNVVLA